MRCCAPLRKKQYKIAKYLVNVLDASISLEGVDEYKAKKSLKSLFSENGMISYFY